MAIAEFRECFAGLWNGPNLGLTAAAIANLLVPAVGSCARSALSAESEREVVGRAPSNRGPVPCL